MESEPNDPDFDRPADLQRLSGPDERVAQAAFERLWERVRAPLLHRLRGRGLPDERCEDVVQLVAVRLWGAREKIRVPGYGAWWRLAWRVAANLVIDDIRREAPYGGGEIVDDDIPDDDLSVLDVLMGYAMDVQRLYTLADRVWLGEADEEAVLAAQYYLVDGLSAEAVVEMLDIRPPEALDRWLADPAVLRRVAYHALYQGNDALAAGLLGIAPRELDAVEEAVQGGGPLPQGWDADGAFLLLRRVRNGLLTDQILRFARCREAREPLEARFGRWVCRYPYSGQAARLRDALRRVGVAERLRDTGLWRRLVFQYHAVDELPYTQILERTGPAAEVAGHPLTLAMLTGWIGMGRLWAQLAKEAEKERVEDEHAD